MERSLVAEHRAASSGGSPPDHLLARASTTDVCHGMGRERPASTIGRSVRMAVVGVSVSQTCGVRDHAVLLAEALNRDHVLCDLHWMWRSDGSFHAARSEVRAWTQRLAVELEASQTDVILLHYSVFAYSYRGLPLFVRPLLAALHSSRIPLIVVLHEFAYPWNHKGWRGTAWALTQRALLVAVVRASSALVVTTDLRVKWLASRSWLPRRPTVVMPVFSNLPPARIGPRISHSRPVIGLFGYSYEGAQISLVLDAVRLLADGDDPVQLRLLGAPGRASSQADAWLAAARARDIEHRLSFSGVLSAQELSDALASCDVLLFADSAGPSSRKTTLAASLASGRPVIAVDGFSRWSELVQSGAVQLTPPTAHGLADSMSALLINESLREMLGARGRAFAQRRMSVARSAEIVGGLLDDVGNIDAT